MAYLGTLTTPQLAEIRQIILGIIDEGEPWMFYDQDEAFANAQRLDFCDEIQRRLIARSVPVNAVEPLVSRELVDGMERIEAAIDRL